MSDVRCYQHMAVHCTVDAVVLPIPDLGYIFQAKLEDDLPHEIVSKLHLVDLAGRYVFQSELSAH